jgi:hypothetical protein
MSAFDRTRAWRRWCNGLCVRTYRVSSTASVPKCVRVLGVLRSNSPSEVERSAHECVCVLGVLRSNSPKRGQTQRLACGRPYISTFERRDPKTKVKIKKNLQESQNTKHTLHTRFLQQKRTKYLQKYLHKQNKIFIQTK